jgi:hypothetical protein
MKHAGRLVDRPDLDIQRLITTSRDNTVIKMSAYELNNLASIPGKGSDFYLRPPPPQVHTE